MARIQKNTIEVYVMGGSEFTGETAKAVAIRVNTGRVSGALNSQKMVWFPKSQLKIGELDEYGNRRVEIPSWLLISNGIDDPRRLDLSHDCTR